MTGPDETGNVALEGRVTPGAWVFAVNRASNTGAFSETDQDGRYRVVLAAKAGDTVLVWYEMDGNSSESVRVTIRQP